jgi:DNA repair exonuclease SbcCD nuclease subunit
MIATIADLHARGRDLEAFSRQFSSALSRAQELGVTTLLLAGDVFHRPNIADSPATTGAVVRAVAEPLAAFAERVPVYAIPGNHDKESAGADDALYALDPIPGVAVIRSPQWVVVNGPNPARVFFFPWSFDGSPIQTLRRAVEDAQTLHTFAKNYPTLLCAHISVVGARFQRAVLARHASACSVTVEELRALPFDRFALGDFHMRQDLTDGRGGYVGALRQLTFGEADNPTGFEVWTPGTGEARFVEIDEAPRHEILTWTQGEPRPEPTPGRRTRILTPGWSPASDLRTPDVSWSVATERTPARLDAGTIASVLGDAHALLDLWLAANPTPDADALHATLTDLLQ